MVRLLLARHLYPVRKDGARLSANPSQLHARVLRERYDTAKFTDAELTAELGDVPGRPYRSPDYFAALRAEIRARETYDEFAARIARDCAATDPGGAASLPSPRLSGYREGRDA